MTCDANVTKGGQLVMLIRNDEDTFYEIAGGVTTRDYTFDNPVDDTTSSSTITDYSEAEFTGFSNATLNVSGKADKRTGMVDPKSGFNIVGSSRLLEIATTGNRCGKFKLFNLDTTGYIEGFFNVTSFSKTGDTPGLLGFDATLQSKSNTTVVGAV